MKIMALHIKKGSISILFSVDRKKKKKRKGGERSGRAAPGKTFWNVEGTRKAKEKKKKKNTIFRTQKLRD